MRMRVAESLALTQELLDSSVLAAAAQAADALTASLRSGGKAIFFGNGGSSMDAGHLAAELVGRFYVDRPALAAVSLADSTAALTAIGNDYSYDEVFARQLSGIARIGDVAVALTSSGDSGNVVRALEMAKDLGLMTVALTGASGGKVAGIVDICIRVPTDDTPRVQELCMLLGHTMCEFVESELFPSSG
jgi:D-sedoheptulose 7-phosphate isomerase